MANDDLPPLPGLRRPFFAEALVVSVPRSDKVYQNPKSVGSLSAALKVFDTLRAAQREHRSIRIVFTVSCWSESRARRVASVLRRRQNCRVTRLRQIPGGTRDRWHVYGSMAPSTYSLTDLEGIWTWLRRTTDLHQVSLVRIELARSAK
jgi:hypothetical protein